MTVEVPAGAFLIVAPVWFNTTFVVLAKRFDYPDMSPGRCMTPGGGITGSEWSGFADGPIQQADSLRLTNEPDVGNARSLSPIDPADGLRVSAGPNTVWRLYVAYVDDWNSPWGTNDSDQTYGVTNASGAPDLIAVWTDDGQLGYTPSELLLGADASPRFRSDADVDAYVSEPSTPQTLPVYEADGETVIGSLTIT